MLVFRRDDCRESRVERVCRRVEQDENAVPSLATSKEGSGRTCCHGVGNVSRDEEVASLALEFAEVSRELV